ncbi:MAG: lipoyl(octanoyl) transferase LipB, partial [Acidimicrobiales bacterium]
MSLRVRWLGRVPYREAWALQRAMHASSADDHLLLLEHPHVYTLGKRADMRHVLVPPAEVGADLVRTDRGGDVTYHGPGQLVGYPIVSLPAKRGERYGMADTVAYVRSVEQLLIDALADLGLPNGGRLRGYPGVWVDPDGDNPRKIAAIGVRLTRGRSMHGFALNVAPDMRYWGYIVPCGIPGKQVSSLADEGVEVDMRTVVDAVTARASALWSKGAAVDRQDVVWRHSPHDLSAFSRGEGPGEAVSTRAENECGAQAGADAPAVAPHSPSVAADAGVPVRLRGRLAQAGVTDGLQIASRKPDWLRSTFRTAPGYL